MEIVIPFIIIAWAFLTKLSLLWPTPLFVVLCDVVHQLGASSIFFWSSDRRSIFSLLSTCWWIASRSLIFWSSSSSCGVEMIAFLFWFQTSLRGSPSWLISSGSRAAPSTIAFFDGMAKVVVRALVVEGGRLSSPEVGTNVGHLFLNAVNQEQGNTIFKH